MDKLYVIITGAEQCGTTFLSQTTKIVNELNIKYESRLKKEA